jgi:hypothetical protein
MTGLIAKNPYPTEADKEAISKLAGLNVKQVSIWFTNTRKVKLNFIKTHNYL